jgi:hypothetical protein
MSYPQTSTRESAVLIQFDNQQHKPRGWQMAEQHHNHQELNK